MTCKTSWKVTPVLAELTLHHEVVKCSKCFGMCKFVVRCVFEVSNAWIHELIKKAFSVRGSYQP